MAKSPSAESQGSEGNTQTLTLLDKIIAEGRMAHDDSQQGYARDMLAEFATQVLDEGMAIDKDTVAMINERIGKIDSLISDQLNEILHHEDVQKLEASWRGLHALVKNTETGTRLKLRLLNVSQKSCKPTWKKPSSLTRARCSRRSTKKSTAPSAATRSAYWSAISRSAVTRRTSACWKNSQALPPPLMHRSLLQPARACST
ncbi:hypothetical protein ALP75_202845 [Pseudomonas syringae pv. actinidiae]|nr:hypothetical protein ALP75_202845 [Pseudomonas syringae pv. actinidiae]